MGAAGFSSRAVLALPATNPHNPPASAARPALPPQSVDNWSVLLKVLLPSMLYRLLPCRWTGRLAMSPMVDEPDRDLGFILLSWQ